MNIRYKLFTCQGAILLITLLFNTDLLVCCFSSHKQTAHTLTTDFSTAYNSTSNSNHSSSPPIHNNSDSIMTSKATNAIGLTAREVDILCAMCQSLKSKPEVFLINHSSLPSLDHKYSLTPTTRPTWRSSPASPASPRRAAPTPTSERS